MTANTNEQVATKEDLLVTRDGDGNLQPVVQELPGTDQVVEVVPLTAGDLNTYDTIGSNQPDNEEVARLFNNHLAMFDEGELSPEDVEDRLPAMKIEPLITAIMKASGQDMQNAVNRENLKMLEGMDEGNLEMLMELADKQGLTE